MAAIAEGVPSPPTVGGPERESGVELGPEPEPSEPFVLSRWTAPVGQHGSQQQRALQNQLDNSLLEPVAKRLAFAGMMHPRLGADSVAATFEATVVDAHVLEKAGAMALETTTAAGSLDVDAAIALLKQGRLLSERQIKVLCELARAILVEEDNVQPVPAPVTICGVLPGHFHELLNIFEVGGHPPSTNYLFLGGYLRGFNTRDSPDSLLTFLLLIALKIRYPRRIHLCRGKFECRFMTQTRPFNYEQKFGFYDECLRIYGTADVWKCCMDVCDTLTLSCVVEDHLFCVHSGLSPELDTFDDIRTVRRFQEQPYEGPIYDLLWNTPEEDIDYWGMAPESADRLFGARVTQQFCHRNNIQQVARSCFVQGGYHYMFDEQLVTIDSNPCVAYTDYSGAIMQLDEQLRTTFLVFEGDPRGTMRRVDEESLDRVTAAGSARRDVAPPGWTRIFDGTYRRQ